MQRTAWIVTCLLLLVGCQRGGKPTADAKADAAASQDENGVQQASFEGTDSSLPVQESPESVVKKFVDALRDGDARTVSNLLTDKARYETRRNGLEVKPELFPDSSFEIEETEFASERKDVAYVGCRWLEPNSGDKPFEIVWIAKRQDEGWRISGMATPLVAGQSPKLLNFENVAEMLAVMESAAADGGAKKARKGEN